VRRTGRRSPRVVGQDRGLPRYSHPGPALRAGSWWASTHFHQLWLDNIPRFLIAGRRSNDANFLHEDGEFGPAPMFLRVTRTCRPSCLRGGIRRGLLTCVQATNCGSYHSVTCPIITLDTRRGTSDLPGLPQYLAPPEAAARRSPARPHCPGGGLVEAWPSDQRVAIIGTATVSVTLRPPRQFWAARSRPRSSTARP